MLRRYFLFSSYFLKGLASPSKSPNTCTPHLHAAGFVILCKKPSSSLSTKNHPSDQFPMLLRYPLVCFSSFFFSCSQLYHCCTMPSMLGGSTLFYNQQLFRNPPTSSPRWWFRDSVHEARSPFRTGNHSSHKLMVPSFRISNLRKRTKHTLLAPRNKTQSV